MHEMQYAFSDHYLMRMKFHIGCIDMIYLHSAFGDALFFYDIQALSFERMPAHNVYTYEIFL